MRRVLIDPPSPREQVHMLLRMPCSACGIVEILGDSEDGPDVDDDGLLSARCGCGGDARDTSWTLVDCARDLGLRTVVRS